MTTATKYHDNNGEREFNLAYFTPESMLDKKTSLKDIVIPILRQLGFRITDRGNRSPVAYISCPQWYQNRVHDSWSTYRNIRETAHDALVEWDKYVNPTISANRIRQFENAAIEPEDIYPLMGMTANDTAEMIELMDQPTEPEDEPQTTETEPTMINLAAPVVAIRSINLVVKVVNPTGKYEVLESSEPNLIPVGKTYNSTVLGQKSLGSIWRAVSHLSQGDSGSVKIDGIEPFENAPVAPVVAVPVVNTPVVVAPVVEPLAQTKPEVQPLEPEPDRTITANLDEWQPHDYYISPNARLVFKMAVECLKRKPNHSVKVLMTGDPGYGKTTIAEKLAEFLGFHCYRMNCAAIRDTEEWFFDREVKTVNGEMNTVFTDSDFVQVLARGNCVMILDEFNRLESNLHNSLFPLLDDSGKTRLHHKDYTVGPNVIFVATVNLGRENSGTFLLDDALTNRFDMILEVRPLPYDHECAVLMARYGISDSESDQIVRLATILRENEFKCSTRDTLKIAKLVAVGMPVRDAFEFVVVLRIPEDESNAPIRKALVDLVNKQLGTRGVEFAFVS